MGRSQRRANMKATLLTIKREFLKAKADPDRIKGAFLFTKIPGEAIDKWIGRGSFSNVIEKLYKWARDNDFEVIPQPPKESGSGTGTGDVIVKVRIRDHVRSETEELKN